MAIHVVAVVMKLIKLMNTNVKRSLKTKSYTEKYIWFNYEAEQATGIHKTNLIVTIILTVQSFVSKPMKNFVKS